MVSHPKKSHYAKACEECQEISALLHQVGDKLCLAQPLSFRDFEIENQQRDNDRVNTVSECAESLSCDIFSKSDTFVKIFITGLGLFPLLQTNVFDCQITTAADHFPICFDKTLKQSALSGNYSTAILLNINFTLVHHMT